MWVSDVLQFKGQIGTFVSNGSDVELKVKPDQLSSRIPMGNIYT